jgi:hypothetical protein
MFDLILSVLYCGTRIPTFGDFHHIQRLAHVGLFQLYTTSLPCHASSHIQNQQKLSWFYQQWDWAVVSTIYTSVASSTVINIWSVHSWWCLWRNLAMYPSELRKS